MPLPTLPCSNLLTLVTLYLSMMRSINQIDRTSAQLKAKCVLLIFEGFCNSLFIQFVAQFQPWIVNSIWILSQENIYSDIYQRRMGYACTSSSLFSIHYFAFNIYRAWTVCSVQTETDLAAGCEGTSVSPLVGYVPRTFSCDTAPFYPYDLNSYFTLRSVLCVKLCYPILLLSVYSYILNVFF